jgi:protein-L-isoaspartate(D-aspartate) O-methyltransferase
MPDFANARRAMVDGQIRVNDVTDLRLVQAFLDVPREAFVPADKKSVAYLDIDLEVASGRALMKPMVLAKLLQAAEVPPDGLVLDVGPATGYTTALLNRLAGAVVAVEEDAALARGLAATLDRLGDAPLDLVVDSHARGVVKSAPYDVILIAGAVEEVPDSLTAQLADGGRLATIVGYGRAGRATIFRRTGDDISTRVVFDAAARPMPGFAKVPAFVF